MKNNESSLQKLILHYQKLLLFLLFFLIKFCSKAKRVGTATKEKGEQSPMLDREKEVIKSSTSLRSYHYN